MIWADPYHREAKHFVSLCTSPSQDEKEGISLLNFSWLTQALRVEREESSDWVMEVAWKLLNKGQML